MKKLILMAVMLTASQTVFAWTYYQNPGYIRQDPQLQFDRNREYWQQQQLIQIESERNRLLQQQQYQTQQQQGQIYQPSGQYINGGRWK